MPDLAPQVPGQRWAERPGPLGDVLLVSGVDSLRTAWKANLLGFALAVVVREAHSVASWVLMSAARSPDLVLLDAELLGPTSAGGAVGVGPRRMRLDAETPRGGIGQGRLVIVGPPPPEDGVRSAMQTGVRGYLFGGGLRRTVALPHVDNVGAAATVRRTVTVADEKGVPRELSHREVEILRHAADGQSNLAIAATLNLSPLTVKSHLGRIGRRLGSGDRARLVYLALRAGAVV